LFPLVFVYLVKGDTCEFPDYIAVSLKQALITQPDCQVILITNSKECSKVSQSLHQSLYPYSQILQQHNNASRFEIVDWLSLASNKTLLFVHNSPGIFPASMNSLWVTSAVRFFLVEDLMKERGYSHLLHIEADNLLYGRLTPVIPILRKHYPLAVTPLTWRLNLLTASVFWVGNIHTLLFFTDFLLNLIDTKSFWFHNYLGKFLRPSGTSVSEMSMLAYFHHLNPTDLYLLPVIPSSSSAYLSTHHIKNISVFSPGGEKSSNPLGHGIFDSGSYGQYLGGTPHEKDPRFVDKGHIIGLAFDTVKCSLIFFCHPSMSDFDVLDMEQLRIEEGVGYVVYWEKRKIKEQQCYTAPYVKCEERSEDKHHHHLHHHHVVSGTNESVQHHLYSSNSTWSNWTPLFNLHVHSKNTKLYQSELCDCSDHQNRGKNFTYFANQQGYFARGSVAEIERYLRR
jgi:hypothetical protein